MNDLEHIIKCPWLLLLSHQLAQAFIVHFHFADFQGWQTLPIPSDVSCLLNAYHQEKHSLRLHISATSKQNLSRVSFVSSQIVAL